MRKSFLLLATSSLLLGLAGPLRAQTVPATDPAATSTEAQIDFAADRLEYLDDADTVTATGDVRLSREGNRIRADRVVWNRKTGEVRALGNVSVVNPGGDTAYGDSVVLTDTLRDGMVDNLLLVLADGGRLAARSGNRHDGVTTLSQAAYSPCPVVDSDGCPKKPSWQISAVRVVHDANRKTIKFSRARLDVFGVPIFVLPTLTVSTSGDGGAGFLVPNVEYTRTNGVELDLPYYFRIAPNRDILLTPRLFSAAPPALAVRYRALTDIGAYQISGFGTLSTRLPSGTVVAPGTLDFRGYLDASGKLQFDPFWSLSGSIRRATDRTLLRRYDISFDDRLRSTVALERIDPTSYFAATGWAVQTLRAGEIQGTIPLAFPEIDYRRRLATPVLGGRVDLQLNALSLERTRGQDTQRTFAAVRWESRRLTNFGQEVLLTAYGRSDLYHSSGNALTTTTAYRGDPGWQARAIGAVAAEVRWPFIGILWNGTQRLTPRLQFVGSLPSSNLNIPNEDARSVDLDDINVFSLNRFPGYDRWEEGARVTYGLDWAFDAPRVSIAATVGQSYRLTNKPTLFPSGTGLDGRVSDIVGRTTVKYRDLVSLTHRYRIDKDSFVLRRNEIDAQVGNDHTYALIGYLRLNRHIGTALEDLRDREEVRVGGRVEIAHHWSAFGSATIDLTSKRMDPTSPSDGYQPVRHRLGIAYTDDCLDIGFTWRRDYDTSGDARRGDSYLLRLAFRNLGR